LLLFVLLFVSANFVFFSWLFFGVFFPQQDLHSSCPGMVGSWEGDKTGDLNCSITQVVIEKPGKFLDMTCLCVCVCVGACSQLQYNCVFRVICMWPSGVSSETSLVVGQRTLVVAELIETLWLKRCFLAVDSKFITSAMEQLTNYALLLCLQYNLVAHIISISNGNVQAGHGWINCQASPGR
jgi:hypothetical protein